MSENESDWWLARYTKIPSIADQLNLFSARQIKVAQGGGRPNPLNWFAEDPLDTPEAKQMLKDLQEKQNGKNS